MVKVLSRPSRAGTERELIHLATATAATSRSRPGVKQPGQARGDLTLANRTSLE